MRKLELKRQTLRELTPRELTTHDLQQAAGGQTPYIRTLPPDHCLALPTAGSECIPQ